MNRMNFKEDVGGDGCDRGLVVRRKNLISFHNFHNFHNFFHQ